MTPEKRHIRRVADMPCAVCGSSPVVVHHIMHMKGKKKRRDDRYIMPLCPYHHNMSDDAVHMWGNEQKWMDHFGLSYEQFIELWRETNEY